MKELFLTNILWISPNGAGINTTLCFPGLSAGEAEKKAVYRFEKYATKLYGSFDDVEIRRVRTESLEYGVISERRWSNPK